MNPEQKESSKICKQQVTVKLSRKPVTGIQKGWYKFDCGKRCWNTSLRIERDKKNITKIEGKNDKTDKYVCDMLTGL